MEGLGELGGGEVLDKLAEDFAFEEDIGEGDVLDAANQQAAQVVGEGMDAVGDNGGHARLGEL